MKKNREKFNLGTTQTLAIEMGKSHRERLTQLVQRIAIKNEEDKYPHLYIYSPPGLGKTYTIKQFLQNQDLDYYEVTGNVSMFAFGIQLAVINYQNPERKPVIIFVDDTDVLFASESSCNTMKNVLTGSRNFTYEKSLASQRGNLSEIQRDAIEHFNEFGKMGFTVPTHNMVFVFASNFKLSDDDDLRIARERGRGRFIMVSHRYAIRTRCNVADFDITGAEQWGWIADVAYNTSCLEVFQVDDLSKKEILNFMWVYWDRLTERSVRLIEKMAVTMKEFPTSYERVWEIDYLKN
jgi:hypothetical protein